ncbi:hypothetical protein NON00_04095 [Roseomonas sp. GC11]|uniref:hypothetical protein n=1 Tax=Roseomonas sp. GC11 TaxID=2950546 RepID=UPI00210D35E4|nr:hypothetical protein [Roseomonas sp. GC11]MCQ4159105.1 hypothetical protein [Roseomonas sp. GC11]
MEMTHRNAATAPAPGADGDQPNLCAALSPLEGALLWSMRAWAIGLSRGIATGQEIAALYADLGIPEGAAVLDAMMLALNQGATRMIDVNCVCHPNLSADELDLVDLLALQQEGRQEDAVAVLLGMAAPRDALAIAQHAGMLVALLHQAGLHLPRGSAALRRHGFRALRAWEGPAPSTCLH